MPGPSFSDLLKDARSRLQALDAQIAESRKKEAATERLDKIERSLAEATTRLTTLSTQMDGLAKRLQALQETGGAVPAELRGRIERMEDAVADLSRRMTGEKETLLAYRQSVKRLVEATAPGRPGDVEEMRKLLETHLATFPERETRVKSIEAKIEKLQTLEARLLDLDAALRKSAEGFDGRLKAVGAVGEELERMKAGIVKEMGTSQAKVETLRQKVERLDAELKEVPPLVKREVEGAMIKTVGDLWTQLKRLEGEVSKMEIAFQGVRAETARAAEQAASASPAEVRRIAHMADELGKGLRALENRVAGGEVRASEALTRTDELRGRLLDAVGPLPEQAEAVKSLQEEVEQLKERMAGGRGATESQQREVREQVGRVEQAVKSQLAELKGQLQNALSVEARLHELEKRIGGEKDLLSTYRSAAKKLMDEMGALKGKDLEALQKALEGRMVQLPQMEAKIKALESEIRPLREMAERSRTAQARLEALERSVVSTAQRVGDLEAGRGAPAGPTADDLRRQRQSIVALLDTLRAGYEQRLLGREEFQAIEQENKQKIAELDAKIAELAGG